MRRIAIVLDLAAVVIFVAIGRSAHGHALTLTGFLSTFWPFATGLLLGWIPIWIRRLPPSSPQQGVLVVSATVGAGMVLRVVSGQGTAVAFVVVALGFLGALMVGWRLAVCQWAVFAGGQRPQDAPTVFRRGAEESDG